MAISFVGSGVGTHAATSEQTYNFSSLLNSSGAAPTLAQGDIVYVVVENASTVNRGAGALVPAGYTAAHTANYQNDTYDSNFQVSYKVMGATPDTSVAIPASNATASGVAYAVYVFRGVNTTTPDSATPVVTGGINTGVANAAAITPLSTDTGAWIVACGGAAVAAGAVFTNPAGMSTTTNHFRSTTITSTTNDANVGVALLTTWTSGAYDPAAFGGSTTTNTGSWSAVTLALKPILDHATTGALAGPGSEIVGSAQHNVPHATSGALTGPDSAIVGSAERTSAFVDHATTGALTGPGSTVAGSAARLRAFSSTGALTGQGAAIVGAATRFREHPASGALTGPESQIVGSAARTGAPVSHATSGDLIGPGTTLSGTAARFRAFESSGALTGAGALIEGAATRTGSPISHDTSGALAGSGAVIVGAATLTSANVDADTHDGYFHKLWRKLKEKPEESTIEAIAERIESIEDEIIAVSSLSLPEKPIYIQSAPIPPIEAQAQLLQALIMEAARLRQELQDEEDAEILLLL